MINIRWKNLEKLVILFKLKLSKNEIKLKKLDENVNKNKKLQQRKWKINWKLPEINKYNNY